MSGRTSSNNARLALVVFVVVQAIVWSHSNYARQSQGGVGTSVFARSAQGLGLVKRSEPSVLPLLGVPNRAELIEEVSVIFYLDYSVGMVSWSDMPI